MKALPFLLVLLSPLLSRAQDPVSGDSMVYATVVKDLEAGRTDIDYRAFRESYLRSPEYTKAGSKADEMDKLRKDLSAAMHVRNSARVIKAAKGILGIDYTDMRAHKALQQTYKMTGDSVKYHKYHDIEFGLLRSIINSGDGKTCATGWHVVQIKEEYFILAMLGAQLKQQSLIYGQPSCDRMDVHSDEGDKTYFFEIDLVLVMEQKMLEGHGTFRRLPPKEAHAKHGRSLRSHRQRRFMEAGLATALFYLRHQRLSLMRKRRPAPRSAAPLYPALAAPGSSPAPA